MNAPIGEGQPVPGALKPHIACPTTTGTGSESTGITIFDYLERHVKTGIAFGNSGVHIPHGMAYSVTVSEDHLRNLYRGASSYW